jgi:hypothetical protein
LTTEAVGHCYNMFILSCIRGLRDLKNGF